MRRAGLAALALLALAAACDRAPRGETYFAAHPAQADRVLGACAEGTVRGDDCVNAERGRAARRAAERLDHYRRTYAP